MVVATSGKVMFSCFMFQSGVGTVRVGVYVPMLYVVCDIRRNGESESQETKCGDYGLLNIQPNR